MEIKTWTVTPDHKARPKNPHAEYIQSPNPVLMMGNYDYKKFEQFAQQHVYHCSPSLVAGEYKAADVELAWQWYDKYEFEWRENNHDFIDYTAFSKFYKNNIESCGDTRQYLQLKQPVPKEITERKTDLGLSNNIEPCPFCGGTEGEQVFLGRTEPDHYQISCICCSVKMKHDRKDKVIGIWNNRNPLSDFN